MAVTGAKVAGKEVLEEAGERVVREALQEGTEKAGKEALEAGAKRSTAEVMEQLAKEQGGDIAKVVTRATPKKAKPPFRISNKHLGDAKLEAEFKRQLKHQQDAINKMKVREWLQNREDFVSRNKKDYAKKTKEARDNYRQREIARRTEENIINKRMTPQAAEEAAQKSMKGEAALHNPDGVAGGKAEQITGMGDGRVNSSIGSQWDKGRAQSIEDQLKTDFGIPPKKISDIPDEEIMNIDLF